jgi:hypothetical protein
LTYPKLPILPWCRTKPETFAAIVQSAKILLATDAFLMPCLSKSVPEPPVLGGPANDVATAAPRPRRQMARDSGGLFGFLGW